MKPTAAVLLAFIATGVAAGSPDSSVTFSDPAAGLKLVSFDRETSMAQYQGVLSLTGTLFVTFDMEAPDKANGEVTFAKFVPDAESLKKLPAAVRGFYSAPIRYVSFEPADQAFVAAFGKDEAERLSHGSAHVVSKSVRAHIRKYTASIECDSRVYWSSDVVVEPLKEMQVATNASAPHGC